MGSKTIWNHVYGNGVYVESSTAIQNGPRKKDGTLSKKFNMQNESTRQHKE